MDELLLHPITEEALVALLHSHPHAILLQGKPGAGKGYAAEVLAAAILGIGYTELSKQPYYSHIIPTNSVIKIEDIRELKRFMQLKTTGKKSIRRVVVIEDVATMTDEAQNALLKLLEEPPADTVLILTSTPSKYVRSTIISRTQHIQLLLPPKEVAISYFQAKNYELSDIERAYAISQGAVGLMQALLTDSEHPLLEYIQLAKKLLSSAEYERLLLVDSIAKDRVAIESLLEALTTVCLAGLEQASKQESSTKGLKRWHRSISAVEQARQAFTYKPSGKLLLTNLFLRM